MGYRTQWLTPALLLLPLLGGCKRQKYEVKTRSPAHAGQAEIVVRADATGNGKIDLEFSHLAPPKRVDSSFASYVVWMASNGGTPYKLGVLEYNAKRRTGSLDATFSEDRMRIIVTLERDSAVGLPTGPRVLDMALVVPKS